MIEDKDWSLKGKENMVGFFYGLDIEVLRQKLIEDIKTEALKAGNEIRWEDCKWIINRRFGVEKYE